jgi:hypothetical protein
MHTSLLFAVLLGLPSLAALDPAPGSLAPSSLEPNSVATGSRSTGSRSTGSLATAPVVGAPAVGAPVGGLDPASQGSGQRLLLDLGSQGYRSWMPDPRDRGLVQGLGLLAPRLSELPGELGGEGELPPGGLEVLGRVISRPMTLRVYELPRVEGQLPLRAELVVVLEDSAAATAMVGQVVELLAMAGFHALDDPLDPGAELLPGGLLALDGPAPAWVGARGEAFVLGLGAVPGAELRRPAPAGPAFDLQLDIGRALELARDFGDDPQLDEVLALLGSDLRLETETIFSAGARVQRLLLAGRKLTLTAPPLGRALLDAMPAQAVWAIASTVSPTQIVRSLRGLGAAGGGEDPLAELEEELGIDLEQDLLAHLGAGWGAYASRATGGGGLMSLAALWEIADREALSAGLSRAADAIGRLGQERARGYARIRTSEHAGVPAWTLVFPGIPIPMQPTLVLGQGYLVLGMHPAGAHTALGFAQGSGRLSSVPRVAEMFATATQDLAGLYYVDSPTLVGDGYGYTLAFGQMLENALRSPTDEAREVPPIVPSLAELLAGALPATGTLRVEDGALRFEARSDASTLARFAAQMGLLPGMYQVLMGPSLVALMPLMMLGTRQSMWVETGPQEPVDGPF